MQERPTSADTIDVADVLRTVRQQWRAVVAFILLGTVGAAAVTLFAPKRFDGKASVLARPGGQSGGSVAGRMSGMGELLGSLGGLSLGGSVDTELQLLRSRVLAGQVVDSLGLQVRVRQPARVPPGQLVVAADLPGSFAPRTYRFESAGPARFRATHDGAVYELTPGVPGSIGTGTLTLRDSILPPRFVLRIEDREDAIERLGRRFAISKAGGDIVKITYRGDDSVTAAAAANGLVKFYLDRRLTTDRGVNQRRVEYVSEQLDSTGARLDRTERELRRHQESSRVFDAAVQGQVELEAAAELRGSLTQLQVEEASIRQFLARAEAGRLAARDFAAYPTFLRGSAVLPLADQLSELEARRLRLLEHRTERDPEVQVIDSTIRIVSSNISRMARGYADAITRQREETQSRMDSIQAALLALPAAAERGGRLQRDVRRLTEIYTALEAQLVEARLAAIGEGGEVRQVDVAVPQRKPAFPLPWLTMGVGTAGGLVSGIVAALFLGWFGRWLRDPTDVERAVGVIAHRFQPDAPLFLAGTPATRTLLVVPLGPGANAGTVAQRLARTAEQRAVHATVLDLSGADGNGGPGSHPTRVGVAIDELERQDGLVIVQLPDIARDVTVAALHESRAVLLVAPPGPVDRARLAHAVDTLRRMQVPCAGVILSDGTAARALR